MVAVGIFDKAVKLMRYSDTTGWADGGIGIGAGLANLTSPFGGDFQLSPVIAKDLGLPYGAAVSALDAYKVPAISRGLALLCGSAAGCTFKTADGSETPEWLNTTYDAITPGMRTAALVADLVLHREAVWFTPRDSAGDILSALHLPRDTWQLDGDGRVLVGGKPLPDQNVLYFQSLRPLGLLVAAADTIDQYLDVNRTLRSRGKNPIPMVEIHVTEQFAGTTTELEQVQKDWAAARRAENGAVAITPAGIELKMHAPPSGGGDALIEARNANRLDVANFLNLPAAMLEGNSGTSGTYENTLQNRDEYVSLSLAEWMLPIQQRLSQPDACGRPILLDSSHLEVSGTAKGNTGTATPETKEITA